MPLLIVIHSHLLDGITASACSLPPFLPASDPHLPDARQGKVLSLHNLKGKFFTYMNTQLSKYNDLDAHPPTLHRFRANGSHTQIAPDFAAPRWCRKCYNIGSYPKILRQLNVNEDNFILTWNSDDTHLPGLRGWVNTRLMAAVLPGVDFLLLDTPKIW